MRGARILGFAGAAAFIAAASVLGLAAPAEAHNYLVSSTPKAGQTLTTLPKAFEITTSGPLLNLSGGRGFALEIRDAAGRFYGDGCVKVSGSTISEAAAVGPAGKYTIIWQVVSTDGHTVSAELPFTWAPTDASSTPSPGAKTPPDCNGTAGGQAPAEPGAAPAKPADANLSDVLWIGGSILGTGIAVVVTLLVLGRRKRTTG
ncbi:MAG: hypothetical protein JWR53_2074 [Glaciihabitans sp.]|nr:hypothetical protein [Glaciihabitans sp.]